ncbi:Alpha/Beta hydrolase fold [Fusarium oxysporum f. sp. vasinfectum]|nr:Alpha/Beta hydrolase fold [Fusarium oxysporum f. sp. vasinfectum]
MSFVYDSTIIHSDSAYVTQGSLDHEVRSLCYLVEEQRSSTDSSSRPIILVAHSPGGLVCATSIVLGDRNAQGDDVDAVARNVAGMVFLGTPFAGSNAAKWGELVRKIFNVAFPEVIRKRNSNAESKVQIVFFFETLDTGGIRIVEDQPASHPGIGETLPLRANHISIYKFESSDNEGYKFVKTKILQMMRGEVKESNDKVTQQVIFFVTLSVEGQYYIVPICRCRPHHIWHTI